MTYEINTAMAKQKMLKAEEELRQHFERSMYDPEREKELAAAVKLARNEFVNQFEVLFPQM